MIDETVTFLKGIAPFNDTEETELAAIAEGMTEERFPPGAQVIRQGVYGVNFYIVRSGLVRVYLLDDDRKETVLAFLGEGDCFGEISLLTKGPTTANIQTVEHTVCLVQPREKFLSMIGQHPLFVNFFNQLLTQRMRSVYKEFLSKEPGITQVEPYLYIKQVKEMISPSGGFIDEKSTIREVAQMMLEKKTGPRIVIDGERRPKGVIGMNTIAKSVLFEQVDPEATVETIMEREFCALDGESYFFDALHCMIKNKTNILVVMDGETAHGVLTGFDLLRFRGREVLSLLRNIDNAADLSQLNTMRGEVEKVLREVMADGALASQACKIVSEFNDKMVKRVIRFAEDQCGPPPSPYAWLGLGSEGRKEQTLFTDQDNGIIYSGTGSGDTKEYFTRFSQSIVDGLNQCGIPLCKGGIMATNPKFFGSIEEWRARTSKWITASALNDKEIMDIYVFLDFRSLHGEPRLEKELRSHMQALVRERPAFLKALAEGIVSIPMPIGFFKNFTVEKGGEHKDRLNLKLYGLVPLITCVKILAVQQGIPETNTMERIKALGRIKAISSDQVETLEQAFETFLTLKIRNNLVDIDQGKAFGNYVNPGELSTRQKQLLKEAFWAVSELQKTTQNALKVTTQDFGMMQ
jgi:CBS domain-containing protein